MLKKVIRAKFKLREYKLELFSFGNIGEVSFDVIRRLDDEGNTEELTFPYYFRVGDEIEMTVNYDIETDQLFKWERFGFNNLTSKNEWHTYTVMPNFPDYTTVGFIGLAQDEKFRVLFNDVDIEDVTDENQPPEILGEIQINQFVPEGSYIMVIVQAKGYVPLQSIKVEYKKGLPGQIPLPSESGWKLFGSIQQPSSTYSNSGFTDSLGIGTYYFKVTVTDSNNLTAVRVHPEIIIVTETSDGPNRQ